MSDKNDTRRKAEQAYAQAASMTEPANHTNDTPDEHVREEITDQIDDKGDAADIAVTAVDELADRAAEIEQVKAELDTTKEQLLRQAAEYQNYRRRTEQEKSALVTHGKALVIQPLLDVLDDLGRSLEAAEKDEKEGGPAYQALKQGVELVHRKFVDELSRLGIEAIEAVGQPFDEHLHEAMMQQPAGDDVAPGTILQELQRGYRMGDRVIRHSKVIVAAS